MHYENMDLENLVVEKVNKEIESRYVVDDRFSFHNHAPKALVRADEGIFLWLISLKIKSYSYALGKIDTCMLQSLRPIVQLRILLLSLHRNGLLFQKEINKNSSYAPSKSICLYLSQG